MTPINLPPPKDDRARFNMPLALLTALVLIVAGIALFWMTPAKAMLSSNKDCQDAAQWHLEQATKDQANQTRHFQTAIAFLLLDKHSVACHGWEKA